MSESKDRAWTALAAAGIVHGARPAASEDRSPWFVRLLVGIGGWLGGLFLVGFIAAAFHFVINSPSAALVIGVVICAAAALLFQIRGPGDFAVHFGFALSLAGQILMTWGSARAFDLQPAALAFVIALQQAALFAVIPHPLHRTWAAATCAYALSHGLMRLGISPYVPFLLTAATAWIWLYELDARGAHSARRAAGYGFALIAVLVTATGRSSALDWFAWTPRASILGGSASTWLGTILCGLVLLWACLVLIRRDGVSLVSPTGRAALAIAVILALAAIKAPGLAPAVTILVLGFANGNRLLAAFGGVALIGYLSHYYYSLSATLLEKSALLAVVGAALLIARIAVQRLWPQSQKELGHA